MANVDATLTERGKRYGEFKQHAEITQSIKEPMWRTPGWDRLNASQKEALEMVAHKIGRILNGDPNYADSWHDIAGYVRLVEQELEQEKEPVEVSPTKPQPGPSTPASVEPARVVAPSAPLPSQPVPSQPFPNAAPSDSSPRIPVKIPDRPVGS
jgi:hypothetical protein